MIGRKRVRKVSRKIYTKVDKIIENFVSLGHFKQEPGRREINKNLTLKRESNMLFYCGDVLAMSVPEKNTILLSAKKIYKPDDGTLTKQEIFKAWGKRDKVYSGASFKHRCAVYFYADVHNFNVIWVPFCPTTWDNAFDLQLAEWYKKEALALYNKYLTTTQANIRTKAKEHFNFLFAEMKRLIDVVRGTTPTNELLHARVKLGLLAEAFNMVGITPEYSYDPSKVLRKYKDKNQNVKFNVTKT